MLTPNLYNWASAKKVAVEYACSGMVVVDRKEEGGNPYSMTSPSPFIAANALAGAEAFLADGISGNQGDA